MKKWAVLILVSLPILAFPKNLNLIGVSVHYSFLSSYFSYNAAGSIQVSNSTSQSDGMGAGIFFDSKFSLYSGIRVHLTVYPSWKSVNNIMNSSFDNFMLEAGVLSKIYLIQTPLNQFNFWFGFGPAFQVTSSLGLNINFSDYVLNIQLAFGASIRVSKRFYLLPELQLGTNLFFGSAEFADVMNNFVNTTDIIQRGFNITLKMGIGYDMFL